MIEHLLNEIIQVHRPVLNPDGRGGRITTFLPIGGVRAKVNQAQAVEGLVAGRDGAMLMVQVHVAYEADVRRGDELDAQEPRRLRVVSTHTNSRASYRRLNCEVVQSGP